MTAGRRVAAHHQAGLVDVHYYFRVVRRRGELRQERRENGILHNEAALELAYVLARQDHRDQAFRAVALTRDSTDVGIRAWVEAALGEQERAVGLLRELGYEPDMHHLAVTNRFRSLLDYQPFQELIRPKG